MLALHLCPQMAPFNEATMRVSFPPHHQLKSSQQDKGQLDDAMRLRSDLHSGSAGIDSGSISSGGSRPQHSASSRLPRMLESWVIYEICNAGNLQDAVMLRDQSVFFVGDIPQIVSALVVALRGVAASELCFTPARQLLLPTQPPTPLSHTQNTTTYQQPTTTTRASCSRRCWVPPRAWPACTAATCCMAT